MTSVFVSRPSRLPESYETPYLEFEKFLADYGIRPRRLGKSDYSMKAPLMAVIDLMEECSGALVMGYPQFEFSFNIRTSGEVKSQSRQYFPTSWNHIEGTLAYSKKLPTLVISEENIAGGIFDHGVTGEFVLNISLADPQWFYKESFLQPFRQWLSHVKINTE